MTRSRQLLFSLTACILLLLPTARATAQDGGYTAVITGNEVEVRSGAGRAYYVVGVMDAGQPVEVVDVLFDASWYQIVVPGNVYSYVSKAFINAQGDGSVGIINADRTECKAAAMRGPGASYRVQHLFDQGDRVEIIAQEGNYYKIVSPAEAYVFVPAGTLRRATAQDLADASEQNDATTDDAGDAQDTDTDTGEPEDSGDAAEQAVEDEQPQVTDVEDSADDAAQGADDAMQDAQDATDDEVVVLPPTIVPEDIELPELPLDPAIADDVNAQSTDAEEAVTDAGTNDESVDEGDADDAEAQAEPVLPVAPDVEVTTPARSDQLIAREMELLPYFAVPIEERPLDYMEAGYREILEAGDLPRVDEQIIAIRLRTISRQREIRTAMSRVQAARATPAPRTQIPDVEPQPRLRIDYEAIGQLQTSSVYDGQSLPRMYRLVDPSGRTVAYVAPTPMIDESALLNSLVGVVGTSTYDSALKLRIITPQQLDALTAE